VLSAGDLIWPVFVHDEEGGRAAGEQGAKHLAALLSARGVHLAAVIDEGLLVTHDSIKGIDAPVALIGIAEKGYVTLELTTEAESGHSSMPPERTAIGTLATALSRLEHTPFEPQLTPAVRQMLATLAPHFGGLQGFAVSHLGVFEGSVLKKLAASPAGNAMTRSTFALTTIHAGNKDNVLPASAKAHVNVRTLTGTSAEDVKRHVRDAIGDDSVSIVVLKGSLDASPLSSATSAFYANIAKSVTDTFQGALVAPGLMLGATDARHFVGLADDVYRFSPVHAWPKDLTRFHGVDERLSVENLNQMVQFYESLLRRL
jgi:carboxypeptidase PM20D1